MSEKTTTSDDPWEGIQPPEEETLISGRRIDPDLPWGLFWAVDIDCRCLLVLQHGADAKSSRRLPELRGLAVEARVLDGDRLIVIRLVDTEQREIFYRFCMDVVRATRAAGSEAEAVELFLGRTWRWHRLLRSGRDSRLTDEEQRGLLGELRLIEEHLLPVLGPAAAVRCWTGPLDAPRDFEISTVHVETKTRTPMRSAVTVSSESQLDPGGCDRLFLHVVTIGPATEGSEGAVTVTDAARRVLGQIEDQDPLAAETFEERLLATGFDWEHDYADSSWLVTEESLFEVKDEFPRITRSLVPPGIEDVRYSLGLPVCEDWRVDFAVLKGALAGESDGS